MSYLQYSMLLDPLFLAPMDNIGFDNTVEDVVNFDISEPTAAKLAREGGVINTDYSIDVSDNNPVEFTLGTPGVQSAVLAVRPGVTTGYTVFSTTDVTVSMSETAGDAFVTIGAETSPALVPGVWSLVVLVGTTWTVEQLTTDERDTMNLQFVTLFDRALTGQETQDLIDMATDGLIHRAIDDADGLLISDDGVTGTRADWHVIGV